jgi:hypothetical protein
MKKIIYLSALLALAACSNDELVRTGTDPSEIRFDVSTNTISRQDLHSSSANIDNFFVTAIVSPDDESVEGDYYTSTNMFTVYFNNEVAMRQTDTSDFAFNSGKKYYWPAEDTKLNFYALHADFNFIATKNKLFEVPYLEVNDEGTTANDIAVVSSELRVSEDADEQDDFLYAVALNQQRNTQKTDNEANKVELNFRHALSQLQFLFDNNANNLYIEVNKVTVKSIDDSNNPAIKTSGKVTFGTSSTTQQYESTGTGSSYSYSDNCTWSDVTDQANASMADVYLDYGVDNSNNDKYLAIYPTTVAETFTTSATYNSDLSTINPAILVIPQKCDNAAEEEVDTSTATGVVKDVKRTGLWLVLHCRVYNTVGNDWMCSDKSDTHSKLVTDDKSGTRRKGVPVFCGKDDSGNPNDTFADLYVQMPPITQGEATSEWKAGKKYVYKLVFGTGNATAEDSTGNKVILPIAFEDVTIDEWGEHTTSLDNIDI